jgi:hypothetical protein
MNVIFRLNQSGCFDPTNPSDFDGGIFKFELRLNFKSYQHWEDFSLNVMDVERERIEEKYGIHDSSGGQENGVEVQEFDSYEIADFYSCSKEWYDFFMKHGVVDKD